MVWDKNRMDGDIISIYVNGQLIEEHLMLSKTKKEIIIQFLEENKNTKFTLKCSECHIKEKINTKIDL